MNWSIFFYTGVNFLLIILVQGETQESSTITTGNPVEDSLFTYNGINYLKSQSSGKQEHVPRKTKKTSRLGSNVKWDIRRVVPGEPGSDYPAYSSIPITSFSCRGRPPGYYADEETRCQVFHVCYSPTFTTKQSFLCPNGSVFSQELLTCEWWTKVNCNDLSVSSEVVDNDSFNNDLVNSQSVTQEVKMIYSGSRPTTAFQIPTTTEKNYKNFVRNNSNTVKPKSVNTTKTETKQQTIRNDDIQLVLDNLFKDIVPVENITINNKQNSGRYLSTNINADIPYYNNTDINKTKVTNFSIKNNSKIASTTNNEKYNSEIFGLKINPNVRNVTTNQNRRKIVSKQNSTEPRYRTVHSNYKTEVVSPISVHRYSQSQRKTTPNFTNSTLDNIYSAVQMSINSELKNQNEYLNNKYNQMLSKTNFKNEFNSSGSNSYVSPANFNEDVFNLDVRTQLMPTIELFKKNVSLHSNDKVNYEGGLVQSVNRNQNVNNKLPSSSNQRPNENMRPAEEFIRGSQNNRIINIKNSTNDFNSFPQLGILLNQYDAVTNIENLINQQITTNDSSPNQFSEQNTNINNDYTILKLNSTADITQFLNNLGINESFIPSESQHFTQLLSYNNISPFNLTQKHEFELNNKTHKNNEPTIQLRELNVQNVGINESPDGESFSGQHEIQITQRPNYNFKNINDNSYLFNKDNKKQYNIINLSEINGENKFPNKQFENTNINKTVGSTALYGLDLLASTNSLINKSNNENRLTLTPALSLLEIHNINKMQGDNNQKGLGALPTIHYHTNNTTLANHPIISQNKIKQEQFVFQPQQSQQFSNNNSQHNQKLTNHNPLQNQQFYYNNSQQNQQFINNNQPQNLSHPKLPRIRNRISQIRDRRLLDAIILPSLGFSLNTDEERKVFNHAVSAGLLDKK